MFKNSLRSVTAIAFAAAVATAISFIPGASDRVVASAPLHSGKGDRLDVRPLGTKCSERAWPYFETNCLRDNRMAMGQARPVRVVTADRINPASLPVR
jgi:hypothetical protein